MHKAILSLVAVVIIIVCGCSASSTEHGHVTGTIKINGQPVAGASVSFAPNEGGRAAFAVTSEDGTYELNYTPGVKAAKIGVNTVTISTYVEPTLDDNRKVVDAGTPERFPPEYNTAANVTVEVKSGENVFDFDVTADKEEYKQKR